MTLLFALYGYSFQIYNDFSGYSDIAIGAAHDGIRAGAQLQSPLPRAERPRVLDALAHLAVDLATRLSLHPSRRQLSQPAESEVNLMVTMLLGGLWHGAALNFIFWGLWHGLLLIWARGARFITFHLVLIGWLLFPAESWEQLRSYTLGLLEMSGGMELSPPYVGVLALACATHFTSHELVEKVLGGFVRLPVPAQAAVNAGLILVFSCLTFGAPAFIYFQF